MGLTGTPASNGLMDLWAEFRLLDMGQRLGRFIGQYRNAYFKPDKQNGYLVYSYKPLPDAEQQIYEKISDITVSMKAIDHLHMPELLPNEYPVQLSDTEQETYKRFKSEWILEMQDTEITAANAASLSNKLSQLANGAVYDDTGAVIPIHNRTVNYCNSLLRSAWRRKVGELTEEIPFEETEDLLLYRELQKLPEKYRQVIHLFYYEEMSVAQIADLLHRKESTIRTQLTRARAMLKEVLGDDYAI